MFVGIETITFILGQQMRIFLLLTIFCSQLTYAGSDPTSFEQQHKILAPDGEELDFFGMDVAILGHSILVSSQNDDDAGTDAGAVYHFILDDETGDYTLNVKLAPEDISSNDEFGSSMAVSDNIVLIGSTFGDEAFIYEYDGDNKSFTRIGHLTAPDSGAGSNFGAAVSIDGDTIAIGAYHADTSSNETGAAYIFEKPDGGWTDMTPTATLTATTPYFRDIFGQHIAISGDTVVVASHWDDEIVDSGGAAYVFEKPDSGWADMTETALLYSTDLEEGDGFGSDVEVSGDTIFVSAKKKDYDNWTTGAVYVFEKPASGWETMTETAKLLPSEAGFDMRGSYFGHALGFDDNILVVSAYYYDNDNSANSIGALFLYEEPGSGWVNATEDKKLLTDDISSTKILGQSLVLSGTTLLAGGPGNSEMGNYAGAAYIFTGTSTSSGVSPGDVDGNSVIDLADTITALQVTAGMEVTAVETDADVNGDGKIGLPEAISSLKVVSGL